MNQMKNKASDQFQYLGRWVDKDHFRAFMHDVNGNQQLANSYAEYEKMIASGLWFAEKPAPVVEKPAAKGKKHDPIRSDG